MSDEVASTVSQPETVTPDLGNEHGKCSVSSLGLLEKPAIFSQPESVTADLNKEHGECWVSSLSHLEKPSTYSQPETMTADLNKENGKCRVSSPLLLQKPATHSQSELGIVNLDNEHRKGWVSSRPGHLEKDEISVQPMEVPSTEDACFETKEQLEFIKVGSPLGNAAESDCLNEEQEAEENPCREENSTADYLLEESCRKDNTVTNRFSALDNNGMKVMGIICCDSCGVTFTSDIYLEVHRRICRGQRKLPEVVDVEKIPPDIQYLAQLRDGKKIYSCHLCAYETPRGGHMTRHMLSHMGARPYICTECNKGFTQSEGLALHRLTHLKVKPFSCSECPFSSARPAALRRHMATHTGEVMFACPHCEYKTAQKYNLKTHVRIHLNDKPYKCSHCEYRAIWKSSVEKHEISVHSTEKTAVCLLCEKKFKLKEELKRHVLRKHTGEPKQRKKRVLKKNSEPN